MAPQTEARDSVFTVKGQKQASVQGKKPGLFDSIASLLRSKQPETLEELEKKVEPAEEVQRAVAEAKRKAEPASPKKPLFGLIGTVVPEEVEYDLFTDGPFSAEYPDWPRLKELPESCVVAVTNGVFTVEVSVEEMEPLTFATYLKKIVSGVEEQLNAKILQKRILLDSAYLEFVLVRDNKLWMYKAKIIECNRKFYTISLNGPKKEFPNIRPIVEHILSSVIVYKAGKPSNVSIEDLRDLSEAERESIEAQMKELETELVESELRLGVTVKGSAEPLEEYIPIPTPTKQPPSSPSVPKARAASPPRATPKPEEKPVSRNHALAGPQHEELAAFLPEALESEELKHLEEELAVLEKESSAPQAPRKAEEPLASPVPESALEPIPVFPVPKPPKARPARTQPKPPKNQPAPAHPPLPPPTPKPEPFPEPLLEPAPTPGKTPPPQAALSTSERARFERKLKTLDEALELGVISLKSYKADGAAIRARLNR